MNHATSREMPSPKEVIAREIAVASKAADEPWRYTTEPSEILDSHNDIIAREVDIDSGNLIARARTGYPAALKALAAIAENLKECDAYFDQGQLCPCVFCETCRPILASFVAEVAGLYTGEGI